MTTRQSTYDSNLRYRVLIRRSILSTGYRDIANDAQTEVKLNLPITLYLAVDVITNIAQATLLADGVESYTTTRIAKAVYSTPSEPSSPRCWCWVLAHVTLSLLHLENIGRDLRSRDIVTWQMLHKELSQTELARYIVLICTYPRGLCAHDTSDVRHESSMSSAQSGNALVGAL